MVNPSHVTADRHSLAVLLIAVPRLTGVDHFSEVLQIHKSTKSIAYCIKRNIISHLMFVSYYRILHIIYDL
jgi:hypothetical protein